MLNPLPIKFINVFKELFTLRFLAMCDADVCASGSKYSVDLAQHLLYVQWCSIATNHSIQKCLIDNNIKRRIRKLHVPNVHLFERDVVLI